MLVKSGFGYSDLPQSDANLGIGANNGGWGSFNGIVDEVAIYNRAISLEEIQQHYQNGLKGLGYEDQIVQGTIDIDPDKLNLKSKGKMMTAYIELPEGFEVNEIDISSVLLEGSIPALMHPANVGDSDNDNVPDLMVKFDRKTLIEYLIGTTGETTLSITGLLSNGASFTGSDIITII